MPGRLTLGQLARASGLARTSLLHYERLGLLLPAGRTAAGYRLYGPQEVERLHLIRRYREAGMPLATIRDLLTAVDRREGRGNPGPAAQLEARLLALCLEVEKLRAQQKTLARLLAAPAFRASHACADKADWVALLRRAGFGEEDMRQWHRDFEADDPAGHAAFLHSLGLPAGEVEAIRQASGPAG